MPAHPRSAGLLVYRRTIHGLEILLLHLGGPLWAKKNEGAWSIPKGLVHEGEEELTAALREFTEETGLPSPDADKLDLGEVKMKSGKTVRAWAVEADLDLSDFKSNLFTMEWPPKSGKQQEFPEADRTRYFPPEEAKAKMHVYQRPLVDQLLVLLNQAK